WSLRTPRDLTKHRLNGVGHRPVDFGVRKADHHRQAQAAAALRPDAVTADLPAGLIEHFFGLGDAIAEPAHEPRVGAEDRRRDHRLNHGRVAAPDVFHDHTTVDAELDRLPHRGILTEVEPG